MKKASGPTADFSNTVPLSSVDNPDAAMTMEWSNALAAIWAYQGQAIEVAFTQHKAKDSQPLQPDDPSQDPHVLVQSMTVRQFFETGTTVIAPELASPGELTQGLCSPWQNDFRECVCYYWASSRPDYVNVEAAVDGGSHGDNWMSKTRSGQYVVDDYNDQRLISHIDLFENWEEVLKFQIGGRMRRRIETDWVLYLDYLHCIPKLAIPEQPVGNGELIYRTIEHDALRPSVHHFHQLQI